MTWNTFGFEKIKKFFENISASGQLSHAYLFSGQEMIGKKTFALELVSFLNNRSDKQAADPDIFFVDTAMSETGQTVNIEEIRKLKNFMSLSPMAGRLKFGVINDAHLMTNEAQNALLKILEEPNISSVLILISSQPSTLLSTVISRCQEIKFPPHKKEDLFLFVNNFSVDTDRAALLVNVSNGRPGLIKSVIESRKVGEPEEAIQEFKNLMKTDLEKRLAFAQKASDDKSKENLSGKLFYWIFYLRSQIFEPKSAELLKNILVLNETLTQPQFSRRLALERFLVSI